MIKKQSQPNTTDRGAKAEAQALSVLEAQGYVLIQKNFRIKGGEIDLIMLDQVAKALVFVEVRSAHSKSPWLRHTVSPAKRQRLWRAMRSFDQRFGKKFRGLGRRFDVIWIEKEQQEHWKNIEITSRCI